MLASYGPASSPNSDWTLTTGRYRDYPVFYNATTDDLAYEDTQLARLVPIPDADADALRREIAPPPAEEPRREEGGLLRYLRGNRWVKHEEWGRAVHYHRDEDAVAAMARLVAKGEQVVRLDDPTRNRAVALLEMDGQSIRIWPGTVKAMQDAPPPSRPISEARAAAQRARQEATVAKMEAHIARRLARVKQEQADADVARTKAQRPALAG